jgi:tetratricopeptide (TPR) repeat protein
VVCAFFGYLEPASAWARIQSLADRALAANPRSGPAHALLAAVAMYRDWNPAEARRLYARSAELEPGANFDHFMHAFFLAFTGELETALGAAREGRRLDPLGFVGLLTEATILTYAGRYDEGLPLAERPIEFDPQFPDGHHIAGYINLSRGEYARAVACLDRAIDLSHRASWPVAKKGCALVGLGRSDEARGLLAELEQRVTTDPTVCAPAIATLHLHLGDHDAFYRWMHRALDQRDPYALGLRVENLWSRARGEPRYRELLHRVGLAEQ